jgi:hypothetical protein
MPVAFDPIPSEIDHVIAQCHGGSTTADNLALACFHCNNIKGTNLAGIDPVSKQAVLLFHPRRQSWRRHFRYVGASLVGRTTIGRASIATLRVNLPHRVAHRRALIAAGVFPPT